MARYFIRLSILLMSIISPTLQAATIIITPAPEPKEVIEEPQGYVSCTVVDAGWDSEDVWHPAYKTCRYDTTKAQYPGTQWVAGHWVCVQYKIVDGNGQCSNWDWKAGEWVKTP